jgi:hypothetical protein
MITITRQHQLRPRLIAPGNRIKKKRKENHVMDQRVFFGLLASSFFHSLGIYNMRTIPNSRVDCGGRSSSPLRVRPFCFLASACTARISLIDIPSPGCYIPMYVYSNCALLACLFFCFVFCFGLVWFYTCYRVTSRAGVIDSRQRSIDSDYQGMLGVISNLLRGLDREARSHHLAAHLMR